MVYEHVGNINTYIEEIDWNNKRACDRSRRKSHRGLRLLVARNKTQIRVMHFPPMFEDFDNSIKCSMALKYHPRTYIFLENINL